jgi:hypothetical protein
MDRESHSQYCSEKRTSHPDDIDWTRKVSTHFVGVATGDACDPVELVRIEIEKMNEIDVGLGHKTHTTFQVRMIFLKNYREALEKGEEKKMISYRPYTAFYSGPAAWNDVRKYVRQYCLDRDSDMLFDLWGFDDEISPPRPEVDPKQYDAWAPGY